MSSKLHVTIYDSYLYGKERYCTKQVWQENTVWWIASLEMGREIGGKSKKKAKKKMNDDGRTSKDTRHEKKGGEERNVKKVKRYGTWMVFKQASLKQRRENKEQRRGWNKENEIRRWRLRELEHRRDKKRNVGSMQQKRDRGRKERREESLIIMEYLACKQAHFCKFGVIFVGKLLLWAS